MRFAGLKLKTRLFAWIGKSPKFPEFYRLPKTLGKWKLPLVSVHGLRLLLVLVRQALRGSFFLSVMYFNHCHLNNQRIERFLDFTM